jgi:hypothetical protein
MHIMLGIALSESWRAAENLKLERLDKSKSLVNY